MHRDMGPVRANVLVNASTNKATTVQLIISHFPLATCCRLPPILGPSGYQATRLPSAVSVGLDSGYLHPAVPTALPRTRMAHMLQPPCCCNEWPILCAAPTSLSALCPTLCSVFPVACTHAPAVYLRESLCLKMRPTAGSQWSGSHSRMVGGLNTGSGAEEGPPAPGDGASASETALEEKGAMAVNSLGHRAPCPVSSARVFASQSRVS